MLQGRKNLQGRTLPFQYDLAAMEVLNPRTQKPMRLGPDRALILLFVSWSSADKIKNAADNEETFFHDGEWWTQDSYEQWQEKMPWLSLKSIERYLLELCALGLLIKRKGRSATHGREPNFYRLPLELKRQIDQGTLPKCDSTVS